MTGAKALRVAPIARKDADAAVKRWHYSGGVVRNSQLHFGVFLGDRLLGAMQFGPSLDKRKTQRLVEGTPWNGFLELNRMAFADALPRNSESRALAVAFRIIRKAYPHIQWVVSFADGTRCGDGTIYRAAGFALTNVRRNTTMVVRSDGSVGSELMNGRHTGGVPLPGFQLRYVYFIDPTARERLTVPVLPFAAIEEAGAGMYRGEKIARPKQATPGHHPDGGGAEPTRTLHDGEASDVSP